MRILTGRPALMLSALLVLVLPRAEVRAQPAGPAPGNFSQRAAVLLHTKGLVKVTRQPSFHVEGTRLTAELGTIDVHTEITHGRGFGILLQTQVEIELLRDYVRKDAVTEVWWRDALRRADETVVAGLQSLSVHGLSPQAAKERADQVRNRVRFGILQDQLRRLLGWLQRADASHAEYTLVMASATFIPFTFLRVTLRTNPEGATVRFSSEWDWELWKLMGEDPRSKMQSVATGELVALDGSYVFELTPADGSAPFLVGPRLVEPIGGVVTLP